MPNTELVGAGRDGAVAAHQDTVSGLARFDQPALDRIAIEPGAAQSSDKVTDVVSPTTSTQDMQQAEAALQALVNSARPAMRPPSSGNAQGARLDRAPDNRLRRTEALARAWAARSDPSVPPIAARFEAPNPRAPSATTPHFRVQIAALRKEVDARSTWDRFQSTLGPLLTGMTSYVERAETGKGIFYRVQVGPFQSRNNAQDLCAKLKKRDVTCFVVAH
jgi:cell division septation protein DedD